MITLLHIRGDISAKQLPAAGFWQTKLREAGRDNVWASLYPSARDEEYRPRYVSTCLRKHLRKQKAVFILLK